MENCQIIHLFFLANKCKKLDASSILHALQEIPRLLQQRDSQAPYQLFRIDQNCSYLQELWSWMSELTSSSTVHMHPLLGAWYLRYNVW